MSPNPTCGLKSQTCPARHAVDHRAAGKWRTVAHTDEAVLSLDAEQYVSRRGPCLQATQLRQPVRVPMAAQE
jgi:hypothetical protein